jgi:heme O synthase-like polyprenyltransferase
VLGLVFLALAVRFAWRLERPDARWLFFGSIIYLPLLWILMIATRV